MAVSEKVVVALIAAGATVAAASIALIGRGIGGKAPPPPAADCSGTGSPTIEGDNNYVFGNCAEGNVVR